MHGQRWGRAGAVLLLRLFLAAGRAREGCRCDAGELSILGCSSRPLFLSTARALRAWSVHARRQQRDGRRRALGRRAVAGEWTRCGWAGIRAQPSGFWLVRGGCGCWAWIATTALGRREIAAAVKVSGETARVLGQDGERSSRTQPV